MKLQSAWKVLNAGYIAREMKTGRYKVSGINCNSCRSSIKTSLSELPGLTSALIEGDILTVESQTEIDQQQLQQALPDKFELSEIEFQPDSEVASTTYKPLIIISLYITVASLVLELFSADGFSIMDWMRYFMAGFFIVFSFFKLLDLSGFSRSYAMYDIVAARWAAWGKIYPFVELILGLLFLTGLFVLQLNVVTLILLSVGTIGVILSNLNKKKIQCACLGTVFNLPMTKVTIIENAVMIIMALIGIVMQLTLQK